ncbi:MULTISPECIES: outer membrane lipoprotein chaperone LolA [Ferrimonas]|uniref:outer membrane lipoprotein chaperone LolA n=1 Tax=Ferrimonas TaxID=44011 RepID=UPI000409A245|nr:MULTISPECIES: outer membrane lipoprotein chaperone LolA [Ferrimonas]USD38980.1 outer membrane lipoprotein chaperone LolA [Ferrimonas sp. SCSIO 43195]
MKRIAIAVALLPLLAHADAQQNLKQKLDNLSQFQAEFQQQVFDEDSNLIQTGQGKLALRAPDRFLWQLTAPEESLLVADGEAVWVYEPLMESVSVYRQDDAIAQTPLTILTRTDEQAWQRYQFSQRGDCFDAEPKDEDSHVRKMSVCFAGETITSLAMTDSQAVRSEFALTNFSTAPLADTMFVFDAPEGTEIDDQRGQ